MDKMARLLMTLLLSHLLLAACASSEKQDSDEPSAARKAAETNTALGRQYLERRQYEVALEKLKRATAHDRTYAPAHTMLGILYETLGQQDIALKEYRLAVQYDPTNGDVNNNYGVFLCGQNKPKEADEYFQVAMRDPFYATPEVVYSNAGRCAISANDLDKAERYLRQSLEYDAELTPALLEMANLNYLNGSYLSARAFLQRFEAVSDVDPQSLLLGYRIENALGDTAASSLYKRTLTNRFSSSAEAALVRTQN